MYRHASRIRDTQTAQILTLAELEATACLWLTWLLTFYYAGITCEESGLAESRLGLGVNLDECTCDGETECLSLALVATTLKVYLDVVLLGNSDFVEGLLNDVLKDRRWEVDLKVFLVDGDVTSTGGNIYAGNGGFTTANCIDYFCHTCLIYLRVLMSITFGCCATSLYSEPS